MKELDVVRIKKSVPHDRIDALSDYDPDIERSGTVIAGDIGTIVEEYAQGHEFTVEFGVERDESLLVDCTVEDLELVEAFKR